MTLKKTEKEIARVSLNLIPVILMVSLISIIKNDYLLTGIYIVIIAVSFLIKYEKKDTLFLILGFIAITISEYFFISTGVETFTRNSLFGIMPLWLPVLWAYGFVVMRRTVNILK